MDYQGNSNKAKEPSEPTPEKKVEAVIEPGKAVIKERGLGSRFHRIFLGGDANTASSYVIAEVILPAFRTLVVDVVTQGIEKFVYGDSRRPRSPSSAGPRIQYNKPVGVTQYAPGRPMISQAPTDRWIRPTKSFDDVIVPTKDDADSVIDALIAIIDSYQVVTLAELHEILGMPTKHVDNKWGWSNLTAIEANQVREGWKITFPPMEQLK